MIIGWCFICAFAVLINEVCLQVTIEGFTGSSVVLPCSLNKHFKLQDTDVLWRDKDSRSIYDLIKGKDSVERQDERYKNRAETFPEDYLRGNFSIKLRNLTDTDAGEFSCFITHLHELQIVKLIIKEATSGKGNESSEQENQGPDWKILGSVIVIALIMIIVAIAGFIYRWKKSYSSDYTEGAMAI
ncbi:hypothetical protein QQF64_018918 [Cirrhinus molitorella]|uniref:Uncharacterized protein n=2 Tax=Cirrhinus molitorella TaxID=172907 RepID=A0ABR3LE08_9TELE|nr:hypothetical protein Q8A67_006116 [Cirrhinus molitorella]